MPRWWRQQAASVAAVLVVATLSLFLVGAIITHSPKYPPGVVLFGAGTAAAPSVTSTPDATTGFYFPASGQVGATASGAASTIWHSAGFMAAVNASYDVGTGAGSRFRNLHLTGGLVVGDGSTTVPTVAGQSSQTTGLAWTTTTGQLLLITAAVERVRVHSTALVVPVGLVAGGSNSNSTIALRGASVSGNGDYISINAGTVERARLHQSGIAFLTTDQDIGDATGSRPRALHVATSVEARMYIARIHSTTIADNTIGATVNIERINPNRQYIELTCSDPDGCTIVMVIGADADGSGLTAGQFVTFARAGTNTVNFSDTAGRSELAGAFAMAVDQMITLVYSGSKWREVSRSAN